MRKQKHPTKVHKAPNQNKQTHQSEQKHPKNRQQSKQKHPSKTNKSP
jgi:hypothetical protein